MSVLYVASDERELAKVIPAIQQLAQGRSNSVGTFTLTASAASTTVTAATCGSGSTVLYMPTTANAAAEIGNGTMYIGTVSNGSFVVTHANNAQVDRTFRWVALG